MVKYKVVGDRMKYIITSGPMETKIDDVRKIQNSSSGRLGATFAEELARAGYSDVVYIHTSGAVRPNSDCKQIEIETHNQLLAHLKEELTDGSVVVHAMAISDFETAGTITKRQFAKLVIDNRSNLKTEDDVVKLLTSSIALQPKLSSSDDQLIVMDRSVKVIDQIKRINPNVKLIGFKLLANTSEAELLEVAKAIKVRASCDYVVANLKERVTSSDHQAYIVGDEGVMQAHTKTEIAQKIIELMEKK